MGVFRYSGYSLIFGPSMPRRPPKPSQPQALCICPTETANGTDGHYPIAISNAASPPQSHISIQRRGSAATSPSRRTHRSSGYCSRVSAAPVSLPVNGTRTEFNAHEVILSCGAIHSPAHLLRAGVGPIDDLLCAPVHGIMQHPKLILSWLAHDLNSIPTILSAVRKFSACIQVIFVLASQPFLRSKAVTAALEGL